jgi:uncharacterized protein (DUF608 family)
MALSLVNGQEITYRTAWANYTWGDSLLEFWDDFLEDGKLHNLFATADSIFNESSSTLTPKPGELPAPVASISDFRVIEPGKESTFKFVISWNFPNRHAWQSTDYGDISQAQYSHDVVGNAYANRSTNAWEAILHIGRST